MTTTADTTPDYRAITERQERTWALDDFARIGSLGVLHGELLCEALDVHPGERVLDVAAGNGAAALTAARRWAEVTATDFVDDLLDSARRVADAYGVTLTTRVADAQCLPFEDDSFDVVMSTFGAMFAPDQQRVADELVRVCRPGGRIGVVNWAPASLIGDVFAVTGRHVPPPLWGSGTCGTRWRPRTASSGSTGDPSGRDEKVGGVPMECRCSEAQTGSGRCKPEAVLLGWDQRCRQEDCGLVSDK